MENKSRANGWPVKLKKKVRYFGKMIKNTKSEVHVPKLASTRKRLTQALNKKYDLASPKSERDWATEVMREVETVCSDLVEAAGGDLDQTIGASSDLKFPHMRETHQCGVNLAAEISNGIRELNKPLTERE